MSTTVAPEAPAGPLALGVAPPLLRASRSVVGAAIAVLWLLVAAFAPLVAPYDPLEQSFVPLVPVCRSPLRHGRARPRRVLARVVYGARISLPLGLLLVVLASTIGGLLGALAGYFRGWVDGAVMRTADLVFAFPAIILAMVVTAAAGRGLTNASSRS